MKRAILCVLVLLLTCGCAQTQEDPFRVDTVVLIPADPTQAPTEAPTEQPTEEPTQPPTEAPIQPPTEPEETTAPKVSAYKNPSSGKYPSSNPQKPQENKPVVPEPVLPPALTPEQPPYNPLSYAVGEKEHALLLEINRHRLEAGIEEVTLDDRLSGIAYLRAQEACVVWSHTRPDGRGYTSVLTDYGYEPAITSELMIYGSVEFDAAHYVGKWMGYKYSRRDICTADFTTAGIGIYTQDGNTFVVCLLIG